MSEKIRVRFAPSPTGYLHVGGLRTALYNFLFAKQNGGTFILRIEDTDRTRYVEGAIENLIKSLKWANIEFDESPNVGGNYGPYIQSERLHIYKKYVDELLEKKFAYKCFCSEERLDVMRKEMEKLKISPKYDRKCLHLLEEEIQKKLNSSLPYVVRMKIPENTTIKFNDIIRGDVEFLSDRIDEQIILKSDGYPTYHLANVVDDHLMEITHVIRGEEWLSSVPKHILLYQYFGWEIPKMAHLPLLLNFDRSKLSKRQGDVAVEDYIAKGFLKEALINFVAFLGWNPGDEREIFSLDELIKEFSLEKVHKAGAIFNLEKLMWMNKQHIMKKSDEELVKFVSAILNNESFSFDYINNVVRLMKERVNTINEFITFSNYFFESPKFFDEKSKEKNWTSQTQNHILFLINKFENLNNFSYDEIETSIKSTSNNFQISTGKIIHPVRLALTGVGMGPSLYELIEVLGKTEVISRLKNALKILP